MLIFGSIPTLWAYTACLYVSAWLSARAEGDQRQSHCLRLATMYSVYFVIVLYCSILCDSVSRLLVSTLCFCVSAHLYWSVLCYCVSTHMYWSVHCVIVFLLTCVGQYVVFLCFCSQSFNMQSLLVEALALRQLGRLNPRQLLTPAYGFRQTTWCPRMMHTRQLWGSSVCFTVGSHRPVVCGRDSMRIWSLHQLRFKSSKKKGLTKVLEEKNELDTDDSDSEDEMEEEDPNLPKDYKDLEKFVSTYRYDAFFKYGTDMARK